ncbi:zinc ribbon domain-containing protein [Okeania sp. KiyG1]|uniref:zinc ribbon domain-containing protein n=1 Tax=Okeania sp. KiyG1 TaxID=2720165 RepID=UPI001923D51E|nr:zinc ribbon domain-containing protein [Okeania sp. KiyG1]
MVVILESLVALEPTSQVCSCCGFKGGKLDLQVREWECLNCGAKHDRDENAAINILVAGGQSETLNGRGGKRNPPHPLPGGARGWVQQPVRRQPAEELRLGRNLRAFRPERMSISH